MPIPTAPPLLTIRNLTKNFSRLEVLKGIDLDIHRGEVVGLIGASGSGKSTLLRCINHLEAATGGEIRLEGELVAGTTRADRHRLRQQRRRMAMVFQQFNLWPHRNALANVIEGPTIVQKISKTVATEKAKLLLAKVGLQGRETFFPTQLSGGQQQRVAIARALALDPTLMLFDEPTSALDPELVGDVLRVMRALAEDGMTMIVVTHEMAFAREVCSKVVYLEEGRIADIGPPGQIFSPDNPKTQRFLSRYHGANAEALL